MADLLPEWASTALQALGLFVLEVILAGFFGLAIVWAYERTKKPIRDDDLDKLS